MVEIERLSPGSLAWLLSKLQDGTADPDEVRQILADFVARVSSGETLPSDLLHGIQDRFREFLDKRHGSLDSAFRLVRSRRGAPVADESRELTIATAILTLRIKDPNLPHLESLERVAKRFGCGTTKAGNAWKRKRSEALGELRARRALSNNGLTKGELARAREIAIPKARICRHK